jgi:hypothetical protein
MTLNKDYFVSDAKFLTLDFDIDYQAMLQEAKNLKEHFVTHRLGSYDHQGWKSLVLHGLAEDKTDHWKQYGYTDIEEVVKDMHWTEISKQCPVTVDFIKNKFPSKLFGRVRFMLLEAGGHIAEHVDSRVPLLDNTNISLSNPEECLWHWGDGESLFMEPGKVYVMNIHYPHSVENKSTEDRYHLIIHRLDCTDEWKEKFDAACVEQGVTGTYYNHEVLV